MSGLQPPVFSTRREGCLGGVTSTTLGKPGRNQAPRVADSVPGAADGGLGAAWRRGKCPFPEPGGVPGAADEEGPRG